MRIIGGKLKRKSLNFLRSLNTRPLKDSVKESIFNVISHSNILNINLNKSQILDLYSGIGSFGIECLSRGASSVTFVEKETKALKILENNLKELILLQNSVIINQKTEEFLSKKQNLQFDIIFLDPPFKDVNFIKDLKLIYKNKIYKKKHAVIIHREKNSSEDLKNVLDILIIKKYGRSKIIFAKFSG
tara:strand:- start:385 stop:948 length:564 start_codon:yes stop_codon:yes gene_type:complete